MTPSRGLAARQKNGPGFGPREAGGPRGPHPSPRVGSQGGMPTRSPPEAGLTGSELYETCTRILLHRSRVCNHADPESAQFAQNPMEDAAVAEVLSLVRGVEADPGREDDRVPGF